MQSTPVIITNISSGNGSYLRITELALAVNDALERAGFKRAKIVLPCLYGEKQKRILTEHVGVRMEDIALDEEYGSLLLPLLFDATSSYEESLRRWLDTVDETEKRVSAYLEAMYGSRVLLELHRSPRLNLSTGAPSYLVSFAFFSDILRASIERKEAEIDKDLLSHAAERMRSIEQRHRLHCLTEPGTFSFAPDRISSFPNRVRAPAILWGQQPPEGEWEKGMYVTVSGITGLDHIYHDAAALGLKIYTNDTQAIPGGTKAPPSLIGHPSIGLHFTRSGWGAALLSIRAMTPLVLTPYHAKDDPEILWNNECLEALGLAVVYRGQSLEELLMLGEKIRIRMKEYTASLVTEFGTDDGSVLIADRIVADALSIKGRVDLPLQDLH